MNQDGECFDLIGALVVGSHRHDALLVPGQQLACHFQVVNRLHLGFERCKGLS